MDFRINRLAGWACGIVGMVVFGWLILGTVTLSGVQVPEKLPEMAKAAEVKGYAPPENISTTCTRDDEVTDSTRKDVKKVTGEKPVQCNYLTDARHGDAVLGGVTAAVVALLIGGAIVLAGDDFSVNRLVALLIIGVVFTIGWYGGPVVGSWLEDVGVIASIFWRGFFAAIAVVGSGVAAHQWHQSMGHD